MFSACKHGNTAQLVTLDPLSNQYVVIMSLMTHDCCGRAREKDGEMRERREGGREEGFSKRMKSLLQLGKALRVLFGCSLAVSALQRCCVEQKKAVASLA